MVSGNANAVNLSTDKKKQQKKTFKTQVIRNLENSKLGTLDMA